MRSENVDFTMVLSMFFDTRLGGKCLIMCNVRAVLRLSWEDLGATWVHFGGILCHIGAILAELGGYLVQLGVT